MGIERDEFLIGERVLFDTDVLVAGVPPPNLSGTTVLLTVQPPGDASEVQPLVTFAPAPHAHAEYVTVAAGWHEWRWETTGSIESARQGRFRVLPLNV